MAKYENEERHLEDLLTNMPKMIDHRSPEEIYNNIISNQNRNLRKKRAFLIPSVIVAAAAILIILISSSFFVQPNNNQVATADKSNVKKDSAEKKTDPLYEKSENLPFLENQNTAADKVDKGKPSSLPKESTEMSAVYEKDMNENDIFNYGVFTKDAIVVPISVIVPKSNSEWLTKYLDTLKKLPFKKWGFSSDPIFTGELEYHQSDKKLHIIINLKDWSKVPEYVEQNLNNILNYSFAYQDDVSEVDFSDEHGNQVELNNTGLLETTIKINKILKKGYFIYENTNGKNLLIPSDEKYDSLGKALKNMKIAPNDYYRPLIPKNIITTVKEESREHVIIQFKDRLNLSNNNVLDYKTMLDGILLTAKNFGYKFVSFKNISPLKWEEYDFSSQISVPISPNGYSFNE
ncbi:hypothetical protein ACQKP0_07375 [Heyndrickxia sp. NPDC080065]|uniref:hypothetical protein n=1 Tax=Heyndrickxia sp. NPDC080065 TaxID=3390568 RepID=UPI003D01DE15